MGSDLSYLLPRQDSPEYDRLAGRRFCVILSGANTTIVYDNLLLAHQGKLVEPAIVKAARDAKDRNPSHDIVPLPGTPAEPEREALRTELNALPNDAFADLIHLRLGHMLQLHDGNYRLALALSSFGITADHCSLQLYARHSLNTDTIFTDSTISGQFLRAKMNGLYAGATRFEQCELRNTTINHGEFTSTPNESMDAIAAGTSIKRTEFHHCDLRDAYVTNTTFRNCVFKDCDFTHTRFAHCSFENCVFDGVTFDNTALEQGCTFTGAHSNLEGITIKNTHLLIDVSVDDAIQGPVATIIRTKTLPEKAQPDSPTPAPRIEAAATTHEGEVPVSAADAAKARWDKPVVNPAATAGGSEHVDKLIEQSGGAVVDMSKWKR